MSVDGRLTASFRDPSGFIFQQNGELFRQINQVYRENYEQLMTSGLYQALVDNRLIVPHQETSFKTETDSGYKIIKPEAIPFISYPYEWSFSQLKDAALVTLAIQKKALDFGLVLKDASAYNIQFYRGQPVLIDTLSFERYQEGRPWIGYRQFCQHFLAPLALMSFRDVRLGQLLRIYLDGIPLDLASQLLPWLTRFMPAYLTHLHLHARSQKHFADKDLPVKILQVSRWSLLAILDSLESAIRKLTWQPKGTEWADYYQITNYSEAAINHKKQLVMDFISRIKPRSVWDLGANTGSFSRLASDQGIPTVAFDSDPAAVEKNYRQVLKQKETNLLPLLLDLTNPSPASGWANQERLSWTERGSVDCVMALALVHHLAISNNLPLAMIAEFFSRLCRYLIIEFVPKSDSQVKKLLASREDIFVNYHQAEFEKQMQQYFKIIKTVPVAESQRVLFLMEKKQPF